MREQDDEQYQTPPRDRNSDKPWGKFSVFDKPLPSTVASSKPDRANETKRRPKEKGLRKLSQRAYEIVLNMRSASYKEVANRLVDELNHEHELDNGVPIGLARKRTSRTSRGGSTTHSTSSSPSAYSARRDARSSATETTNSPSNRTEPSNDGGSSQKNRKQSKPKARPSQT